jgi:hypothetical protein
MVDSQSDSRIDVFISQVKFDLAYWDDFNRMIGVITELRPTLIDYLSLVGDFTLLDNVETELASSLQDTPNPTQFVGIIRTLAYATAQRALSNFLSATSAFRDRNKTRLCERYGKDSPESGAFRVAVKAKYDNSFAYRVLYNLRNYAQHHDSPVSVLPIKGTRGSAELSMSFNVKLVLHRDELCRSRLVQKSVRNELQSQPQSEFELIPLARDYMHRHAEIMREIISLQLPRLLEMQRFADVIVAKSNVPKGAIPVIWEGMVPTADAPECGTLDYTVHSFSFDELVH